MQITLIVTGVLITVFIIFRSVMMWKIKNTPMVADHENVLTLTDKNFQQ
jgi:thioredoxin 1